MEPYLGTICAFGFNYAPYSWAFCAGQIMPIAQYSALFSLLGTAYGGNGTSTFGLPNLQGRVANHMGQLAGGSLYVIGEMAGTNSVTILSSNMPAHNHNVTMAINVNNTATTTNNPSGAYPALASVAKTVNSAATSNINMAAPTITLGASGGTAPIDITDPYLVLNYCIALQGIFPTRN